LKAVTPTIRVDTQENGAAPYLPIFVFPLYNIISLVLIDTRRKKQQQQPSSFILFYGSKKPKE
jgi:hypothetical protein